MSMSTVQSNTGCAVTCDNVMNNKFQTRPGDSHQGNGVSEYLASLPSAFDTSLKLNPNSGCTERLADIDVEALMDEAAALEAPVDEAAGTDYRSQVSVSQFSMEELDNISEVTSESHSQSQQQHGLGYSGIAMSRGHEHANPGSGTVAGQLQALSESSPFLGTDLPSGL